MIRGILAEATRGSQIILPQATLLLLVILALYAQPDAYNYNAVDADSGTESDTSSDYDGFTDNAIGPAIAQLTPTQQDQHYRQTYKSAERSFRSHFRKPTRHVRRFVKRKGEGKGKGKGKGKHRYSFLADFSEQDIDNFFGGKGKSKGKGMSSATGKGRRRNPTRRDGEVMLCDVPLPSGQPCNSDTHTHTCGSPSLPQHLWMHRLVSSNGAVPTAVSRWRTNR